MQRLCVAARSLPRSGAFALRAAPPRGLATAPTTTTTPPNKSKSGRDDDDDDEVEGPVSYLESEAARWKARSSRYYGTDDAPWYQPYVVSISTAVFLLYFCVLREESDIDREFDKTLYERVPGMEKQQLLRLHQSYLDDGRSVVEIERRLKEIIREERASGALQTAQTAQTKNRAA